MLSQYVAYLDRQIVEVALDRYAQADDGSVWYFGEDVIDYENGGAYFTEGTWLTGRDGPPAMVMPAILRVGDVFRVENVIGIVFEELTVITGRQDDARSQRTGDRRDCRRRTRGDRRPFAQDARAGLRRVPHTWGRRT